MIITIIKTSCTRPANTLCQSLLLKTLCLHKHVERVTGAKMLLYIYFDTNLLKLPNSLNRHNSRWLWTADEVALGMMVNLSEKDIDQIPDEATR